MAGEVGPDPESLERINDAVRSVIDQVRRTNAPVDALATATIALERVAEALAPYAVEGPYCQGSLDPAQAHDPAERPGDALELLPYSPIMGPRNPIAPPIAFGFRDDAIHASCTFGAAYAGAPGIVHGGVVALAFDELLSLSNLAHGSRAMTGTLTVRYRQPTPLGVPLELRARTVRFEGRKLFASGEVRHGDTVTAEAEAVFVRARDAAPQAG